MRIDRWKRLSPSLLWDGFMVYLATINLLLILFDFSYLWLRPVYVRRLPWVAAHYDPVLGVEPHPFSEGYLELADRVAAGLGRGEPVEALAADLEELRRLSVDMLADNPFALSRPRSLERVKHWVLRAVGEPPRAAVDHAAVEAAFRRFWSAEPDRRSLEARLDLYRREIAPLMRANYFRLYDADGDHLKSAFWKIDLPFLLLFAGEFAVRWTLALRRRLYPRWYHFPLLNWYDVLGLIPYFRVFRLFRLVSIYVRLHRSELTRVGDDVISRSIKFASRIIAEEISDLVTLRILTSAQLRIREGAYAEIVRRTLAPRRETIRVEVVDALRRLLASEELRRRLREFLRLSLDQSLESSEALRGLPLPDGVLRPVVRAVGGAIYESLLRTVTDTLESDAGRRALEEAVGALLEVTLVDLGAGDLEAMVEEVALEILERTKATVATREWAGEDWRRTS